MVNVCILIRIHPGKANDAIAALRGVAEIREFFPVFGRYDFVAFANVADHRAAVALAGKINSLSAIRSTETLIEA